MPLFGPKKSPPFEPFKSKTFLKCATARIKQETAKKQNANKVLAKELGTLLRDGKEEMARIRVEDAFYELVIDQNLSSSMKCPSGSDWEKRNPHPQLLPSPGPNLHQALRVPPWSKNDNRPYFGLIRRLPEFRTR